MLFVECDMHVIYYCFNAVSHRPSKLTAVRRINVVCWSENGGIHALNEEEDYSPVTEAHLFLKFHKVFQSSRCHGIGKVRYSILHERAVFDFNETTATVGVIQSQVQSVNAGCTLPRCSLFRNRKGPLFCLQLKSA